jgi:hypothetical protein
MSLTKCYRLQDYDDWDAAQGANSLTLSDEEPYSATISRNLWDSWNDEMFNPQKRRRDTASASSIMSSASNSPKARRPLTSPPHVRPPRKKMIVPADPSSSGPSRGPSTDGGAQSARMTLQSRIAVPANAPKPRGARVFRGRRGHARPPG